MKKEILAGLIAIVAIAAIAIFTVTSSMSTSFELDGKLTSDELELLFLGSADDEYQEYKYVSEQNEKSRISASAGGAEVYEAGLLPEFLEKWIDKLFEFLSGTDPKELGEDLYEKVDEEYPHYDEAGEPGPTPAAGEATGEYAGPKELIIDGKQTEGEIDMLEAMGVGEIVYNEAERVVSYKTNIRCVKSSHIAFLKDSNGQYSLYYHENVDPLATEIRSLRISSPSDYPIIVASIDNEACGLLENKSAHAIGIDALPSSHKYETAHAYTPDRLGLELIVKGLSPDAVKRDILEGIGTDIMLSTAGGTAKLNVDKIPILKGVLIK